MSGSITIPAVMFASALIATLTYVSTTDAFNDGTIYKAQTESENIQQQRREETARMLQIEEERLQSRRRELVHDCKWEAMKYARIDTKDWNPGVVQINESGTGISIGQMRFQNGFGVYIPHAVACSYDNWKLTHVRVEEVR